MSIIAAGVTTTTALVQTGNTDGTIQLQVNGTTPSVTLNALGAVGVGSSPSYGTSGQVLTSAGSGAAPTWSSVPATTPAGSTGQVQYNNAGAFGAISSGTSGQVLTSAGAGAAPTWTTPSGGGLILIETVSFSGASTVDITSISSTYDNYLLIFDDVIGSVDGPLGFQLYIGGAYRASAYKYAASGFNLGSSVSSTAETAVSSGRFGYLGSGTPCNATAYFLGVNTTTSYKFYSSTSTYLSGTNGESGVGAWTGAVGALSGIRVLNRNGGTITGVYRLYGFKNS